MRCAVIGAGPAGCVVALELARAGLEVHLFDSARSCQVRPGETLPSSAKPLLQQLDLWHPFLATKPIESPGNLSLWGDEVPRATDFVFSPYGSGWHLDRAVFDAMLVHAAKRAGTVLHRDYRAARIKVSGVGSELLCVRGEGAKRLRFDLLVLANGRNGRVPDQTPARRRFDRLCACFVLAAKTSRDARTWIEAESGGWWYSTPATYDRIALAYVTDADLLPVGKHRATVLSRKLAATQLMRHRQTEPVGKWRVVDARSTALRIDTGSRFLAAGDAALSFDPLSSGGLRFALESGWRCASALLKEWGLSAYVAWLQTVQQEYMQQRTSAYAMERRWTTTPFWRRRVTAVEASDSHHASGHSGAL